MNKREKLLLTIIGSVLGVFVLYKGVDFVFISPVSNATNRIAELESENTRLSGVIRSRRLLARQWLDYSERTLSADRAKARNVFDHEIKEIAKRHGFGSGTYSGGAGGKIGGRTNINAISHRVVEEGRFAKMLGFLKDIYQTPYLCQITRLSISPISDRGRGRDEVKFDVTIETPLLPPVDAKKIPELKTATTLPVEALASMKPARAELRFAQDFPLLDDRNIFRRYIAPPTNIVMVDNQDWEPVFIRVKFLWDGRARKEIVETVPRKSQKPIAGEGDQVEINGTYKDASVIGPRTLSFIERKEWIFEVPVHSPAPPPDVVDLAVENQDRNPVDVQIALVLKDSTSKLKPLMRIPPGSNQEIDQFQALSVQVFATYASGKKTAPKTYTPGVERQVYLVPPEPAADAVVVATDQAPDPNLSVTGLVSYPGAQEMIAFGPGNPPRRVIKAGEPLAVDGGTLLAIHPQGGVVKMPTGNYYLYPLGKRFAERVKLEAREDTDLAAAIDACGPH